jgi:predicted O-methyltransferase YrrM
MSHAHGNGRAPAPRPATDMRIVLGMPGYGELTAGASRGLWRASRAPEADVAAGSPGIVTVYQEGSLLAANFNALWCVALNLARTGWRPDYFAMIHADVEPEDWWLDALVAELEARDLDVLGVAVPIKDGKGLTSIALDRPDGDPWRPLARLTMREVFRLPETFTSADVGHPLLLNTGLWACRFDESWARKVHFTINDRIVVGPGGEYRAQCEPEDWRFSRLLHEIGRPGSPTAGRPPLRIGCTRKVRLTHRGPHQWPNQAVWGEPFDAAWTDRSVLAPAADGFALPDVDGWLRPAEGAALAELARGKRVLEVGSYCGLSTICLARTAAHVVSVDTHDGRGTPGPRRDTLAELRANLERHGVADKVSVRVGRLYRADPKTAGRFDLIFIDGAHDADSVAHDVACGLDRLAPGGLLAFHDYGATAGPGDGREPAVTAAVDALVAAGGELRSITDSLAVVKPPASVPASLALAPLEV